MAPRFPNTPCASSEADWPLGAARFYALDTVNGSDSNRGYSDVSLSAAGAVAVKTPAKLYEIIPKLGAGRRIMIGIGAGTYTTNLITQGIVGYEIITFRATQFLDTTADKYKLAGTTIVPGPNVDGSWTVQSISGRRVTVASGSLPTDRSANFWKIQWKGNVTAGAITTPRGLQRVVTTATFDVTADVTVAAGDDFFIEAPSVIFPGLQDGGDNPQATSGSLRGMAFAGIQFTNATNFITTGDGISIAFCYFPGGVNIRTARSVNINGDYRDENGTTITLRHSLRALLSFELLSPVSANICRFIGVIAATVSTVVAKFFIAGDITSCLAGSYVYGTTNFSNGGFLSQAAGNSSEIGNGPSGTTFQIAVLNGLLNLRGVRARLYGIDVSNGASDAIQVSGDSHVSLNTVTGTGSAGYGISVANGVGAQVVLESGVTVTGTSGDVLMGGTLVKTYADVAADGFTDKFNNVVSQITLGFLTTKKTAGTIGNAPILAADPASPVDGDFWIRDTGGVRTFCARIDGTTYRATLT